jgi:hypothetical protein
MQHNPVVQMCRNLQMYRDGSNSIVKCVQHAAHVDLLEPRVRVMRCDGASWRITRTRYATAVCICVRMEQSEVGAYCTGRSKNAISDISFFCRPAFVVACTGCSERKLPDIILHSVVQRRMRIGQ